MANYQPKNTLINGLRLLAKIEGVSERTHADCASYEQKYSYFRQGYVDLGLGRHAHISDDIRKHTVGFALASAEGVVQQTYSTYAAAESARQGAVPKLAPEPEPEAPAATEQMAMFPAA